MQVFRVMVMVVGLLAGFRTASADPPLPRPTSQDALDHLEKAARFYDNRDFERAIEEYKVGNVVEPSAIFDYDLGQSYRQMHRYTEAIWHYKRFLKASPQTTSRNAKLQELIDQMQAELDQKAMTAPPTEAATAPVQPASTPAITPAAPEGRDWLAYGLLGGGAIAVGVSAGMFVSARSLHDEGNNTHQQSESNALHERADSRKLVGTVVGIAGLGLVAVGTIKLVLHRPSTTSNATALNLGVSPNGLLVFGSF